MTTRQTRSSRLIGWCDYLEETMGQIRRAVGTLVAGCVLALAGSSCGSYSTPGMNAMALSAALNTSHRSMPNFVLAPDEQSDIAAYILSLK